MKRPILIIEDDTTLNHLITQQLARAGFSTTGATSWSAAQSYLATKEPALIITDVRLPDGDSIQLLPELVETYPVIVLTAFGSVRDAVDSMKRGAADYLLKPVSFDELLLTVERTLENAQLRQENQFCKRQLRARDARNGLVIGESAVIDDVLRTVEAVAKEDITVLVQGESGTGKELIAREVHDNSPRRKRSFVTVDCCTLQEKLFESELFGHEKGAFTGADRQKKGLIEGAEGGTLFLDEIGEIDGSIQAKLLRVLETGQFRRLGGTKDLSANVRVVAATNRNLGDMVEDGAFRPDLFYRLNGFNILVPPLRDRRDDIPALAEHFIRNHSFSRRIEKQLKKAAVRKLVAYNWPGNIRELKNVMERAIILSRDKPWIGPEHLAFGSSQRQSAAALTLSFNQDPTLEQIEAEYLSRLLKKFSGRRAEVADTLGVSERSVYRMIKRFDLENG
ncbi:MAG TPA: sigma-54 dependent transcriptional regulator [Denitromonas sp.]|nr:sigma-54-dependent Fis family transcriptional regulator [Chromatiaceae bacterium]MCP5436326.1 sigma-54-dependent Fis family transcriptional regulator [Chromatiaceae bacterium]MCP5438895.1 sigma-54-dependent Fis family transcriptional regulator [Chromatiaceae bacterium]HPR05775.1 sigma-54 dependent transcriptional regulator [Denitromonas sp.]